MAQLDQADGSETTNGWSIYGSAFGPDMADRPSIVAPDYSHMGLGRVSSEVGSTLKTNVGSLLPIC